MQRELPGRWCFRWPTSATTRCIWIRSRNLNQPQPSLAVANGAVNVNTVRPYLGYGNIDWDERNASARYNALQASANRRFD